MSKVNATCPACQKRFLVSPQMIGKNGRCSSCQKVFVLRTKDPLPEEVVRKKKVASEPQPRKPQPKKANRLQRTAAASPSGLQPSPARQKRPPNSVSMDLGQNAHAKIKNLSPLFEGKRVRTGRVSFLYRINILFTSFVIIVDSKQPALQYCGEYTAPSGRGNFTDCHKLFNGKPKAYCA